MSLLLALLRANVAMDSVGREADMGAAGGTFSGDSDTECIVEAVEACLLCELVALRRLVLRLLRSCRPSSPTLLAMLCREFRRFCGVVGDAYWRGGDWMSDAVSGGGGVLGVGSSLIGDVGEVSAGGGLLRIALLFLLPKTLLKTLEGVSMAHSSPGVGMAGAPG